MKNNAFTLIELLVVLVVISILVGITIPVSKYVTMRAQQANYEVQMAKIKNALEEYRTRYGEYPVTPNYAGVAQDPISVGCHYPESLATECYTVYANQPADKKTAPTDFTNVAAASSTDWPTIEYITVPGTTYKIDYALTYPLIIAPLTRNELPFYADAEKSKLTVLSLITTTPPRADDKIYKFSYTRSGRIRRDVIDRRFGWPINRYVITDPRSRYQIKYESNGTEYSLTNHVF